MAPSLSSPRPPASIGDSSPPATRTLTPAGTQAAVSPSWDSQPVCTHTWSGQSEESTRTRPAATSIVREIPPSPATSTTVSFRSDTVCSPAGDWITTTSPAGRGQNNSAADTSAAANTTAAASRSPPLHSRRALGALPVGGFLRPVI